MAAFIAAVFLVVEIALSMLWPTVVPRLALLPKPVERHWYDGCNWHDRKATRPGPIWGFADYSTDRACLDGPVPP